MKSLHFTLIENKDLTKAAVGDAPQRVLQDLENQQKEVEVSQTGKWW